MDSSHTAPSTPPRSSGAREYPATPATPRFGTFEDLPDLPRKPEAKPPVTPARPKRKRVNLLETPRQTPRKRSSTKRKAEAKTEVKTEARQDEIIGGMHPHMDKPPPNVPGMWYVFRGKRIFRPLPAGEKPLKPVTLFKTQEEDEEADTDIEDNNA